MDSSPFSSSLSLASAPVTIRKKWYPGPLLHEGQGGRIAERWKEDAENTREFWVLFEAPVKKKRLQESELELLYLNVSDIGLEKPAIVAAASKYGALLSASFESSVGYVIGNEPHPDEKYAFAEPIAEWRFWITAFRALCLCQELSLSASVERARETGAELLAIWQRMCNASTTGRSSMSAIEGHRLQILMSELKHREDWHRFGSETIGRYLNEYLPAFCRPSVHLGRKNALALNGSGLVAATTISFVMAMLPGAGIPTTCPGCGRWLSVKNNNKTHCGPACRVTASRRRTRLAQLTEGETNG